jgi:hypothetical protein
MSYIRKKDYTPGSEGIILEDEYLGILDDLRAIDSELLTSDDNATFLNALKELYNNKRYIFTPQGNTLYPINETIPLTNVIIFLVNKDIENDNDLFISDYISNIKFPITKMDGDNLVSCTKDDIKVNTFYILVKGNDGYLLKSIYDLNIYDILDDDINTNEAIIKGNTNIILDPLTNNLIDSNESIYQFLLLLPKGYIGFNYNFKFNLTIATGANKDKLITHSGIIFGKLAVNNIPKILSTTNEVDGNISIEIYDELIDNRVPIKFTYEEDGSPYWFNLKNFEITEAIIYSDDNVDFKDFIVKSADNVTINSIGKYRAQNSRLIIDKVFNNELDELFNNLSISTDYTDRPFGKKIEIINNEYYLVYSFGRQTTTSYNFKIAFKLIPDSLDTVLVQRYGGDNWHSLNKFKPLDGNTFVGSLSGDGELGDITLNTLLQRLMGLDQSLSAKEDASTSILRANQSVGRYKAKDPEYSDDAVTLGYAEANYYHSDDNVEIEGVVNWENVDKTVRGIHDNALYSTLDDPNIFNTFQDSHFIKKIDNKYLIGARYRVDASENFHSNLKSGIIDNNGNVYWQQANIDNKEMTLNINPQEDSYSVITNKSIRRVTFEDGSKKDLILYPEMTHSQYISQVINDRNSLIHTRVNVGHLGIGQIFYLYKLLPDKTNNTIYPTEIYSYSEIGTFAFNEHWCLYYDNYTRKVKFAGKNYDNIQIAGSNAPLDNPNFITIDDSRFNNNVISIHTFSSMKAVIIETNNGSYIKGESISGDNYSDWTKITDTDGNDISFIKSIVGHPSSGYMAILTAENKIYYTDDSRTMFTLLDTPTDMVLYRLVGAQVKFFVAVTYGNIWDYYEGGPQKCYSYGGVGDGSLGSFRGYDGEFATIEYSGNIDNIIVSDLAFIGGGTIALCKRSVMSSDNGNAYQPSVTIEAVGSTENLLDFNVFLERPTIIDNRALVNAKTEMPAILPVGDTAIIHIGDRFYSYSTGLGEKSNGRLNEIDLFKG